MPFAPALPHSSITPVVDGVHVVRGSFRFGPGMVISRTMTIVKHGDGLVLLNAVRLDDTALQELDRLGPVKHLVKLSESHAIDEAFYADRYKPEVWAMAGAKFEGNIKATQTLGPASPIEGAVVIEYPGTSGWKERSLWIPSGGGTLIACDALQHYPEGDRQYFSFFGGLMTSMMGFKGGLIVAPMWRKMQKVRGEQLEQALAGISKLSFANLVCGHGPAIIGGADARVRETIERAVAQG